MELNNFDRNRVGEKIILFLKSKSNGIVSKNEINGLRLGEWKDVYAVIKYLEDYQLVKQIGQKLRLTPEGLKFKSFEEFETERNKDDLKLDLEIKKLKKELKDYPIYKALAIIGTVSGIAGVIIGLFFH